jgi:hypothetical protein
VTLDGHSTFGNGFAPDPGAFQQLLFSAAGLENGAHELVVENPSADPSRPFLDVDFATFTTGDSSK